MRTAIFALALSLFIVAVSPGFAAEGQDRWKLDITWGTPDYVVMDSVVGDGHLVWYLTYEVTNNTDRDVPLGVKIKAKTDTDRVYVDTPHPRAMKILEKQGMKNVRSALKMNQGTIAPGETVKGVAIFGEIDANYDWLHVHISGLWDKIEKVDGKLYFEDKVLALAWYRPGDEYRAAEDVLQFKGKKWIIVGERKEIPQREIK